MLCGWRLRRGGGHGVASEGSEREPVGALQKKVSVGLVEWFALAVKVGAMFYAQDDSLTTVTRLLAILNSYLAICMLKMIAH